MPFIVRCPKPGCQKYMLLEDAARGQTVNCLVCKSPIRVDPSNTNEAVAPAVAAAPATSSAGTPPPRKPAQRKPQAQQSEIRTCPACGTKMKVPKTAAQQKIKCPKCGHVF